MSVILVNPVQAHAAFREAWMHAKAMLMAGHRLVLDIKPETRSLAQNARLWSMLTDVSRQVVWHGKRLSPEEWKHVFTAAVTRQQVVPGIDGGFVVLGTSTSRMTRAEMGELQELIEAFGAQQGVRFTASEVDE